MSDKKPQLLERALLAAPAPIEWDLSSTDPDDLQRWANRYSIWFQEIRCAVLGENSTYNIYYSKERLVREAHEIQEEITPGPASPPLLPTEEEEAAPVPKITSAIRIGQPIPTKK